MNQLEIIQPNINSYWSLTLLLFKMKILSIILTGLSLLILLRVLHSAISLYMGYSGLKEFGIPLKQVNTWELPYIVLFILYSIACVFSVFFTVKKRYILSDIVSIVIISSYFVIPLFGFQWLKWAWFSIHSLFKMKILSICLTILLSIFFIGCLLGVFQAFYVYNNPLIANEIQISIAKPYIYLGAVISLFLLTSFYLIKQKRYTFNIIVVSFAIVLHFILANFVVNFAWFESVWFQTPTVFLTIPFLNILKKLTRYGMLVISATLNWWIN